MLIEFLSWAGAGRSLCPGYCKSACREAAIWLV